MADDTATGVRLRLLSVVVAASAVLPAVMFAWAGWANYKKVNAHADERIVRSLDVEQEHATG